MAGYVQTALENEIRAMQGAAAGSRNRQAFVSACNLWGLVKAGALDESTARAALWAAAAATGLPESEFAAAWQSAGRRAEPRTLPTGARPLQQWAMAAPVTVDPPAAPSGARSTPQSRDWRDKAHRDASAAYSALRAADGAAGRDYLQRRGLQPSTWDAFRVGYAPAIGYGWLPEERRYTGYAPALVLPWYVNGQCTGIRYRYIEPVTVDGQTVKSKSKYGSRYADEKGIFVYSGATAFDRREPKGTKTLILIEGELNAMSVWQTGGFDVLSYGSQTATGLPSALVRLAAVYRRRIVWADVADVAHRLKDQLPAAIALQSPRGLDANDLLQRGILADFLERIIEQTEGGAMA